MESDYGITEYIGLTGSTVSLTPIPCILKELYSDFRVQEILADKTVLPLFSEEKAAESIVKKVENGNIEETTNEQELERPSFLSEEAQKTLDEVHEKRLKPKTFIEIGELSKEQRREIHEYIRNRYKEQINSKTDGTKITIEFVGNSEKGRKRRRWDPNTPEFLHFTMAKENKDTSYALGILGQLIHGNCLDFRTQGIKDRRALTVQRVSVHHIEKDKLLALNARLRDIRVYDCAYANEHVKMGGHWGNRFGIVLRNVGKENREVLEERMKIFAKNGFINYYGTQRFGSLTTSTAEVGRLMLLRKWEEAVRAVLCDNHQEEYGKNQPTIEDATAHWRNTGDAKAAVKMLRGATAHASLEGSLLKALSRGSTYQQCLTEVMNMNSRSLYIHAYQSLLWNKVASRRVKELGIRVVPGDRNEKGEELSAESSQITHIAIPLPGVSSLFEGTKVQEWLDELLAADGLDKNSFESMKKNFALGEMARPLFVVPEDVDWKFIEYAQPRQFIQDGLLSRLPSTPSESLDPLLALKLSFNLPSGSYATVALRQVTGWDMGKKAQKQLSAGSIPREKQHNGNGAASTLKTDENAHEAIADE